jgi:hypothetical protein
MNEEFAFLIEKIRSRDSVNYVDAVLIWAEENSIEVETVAQMIKKDNILSSKIMAEAEKSRMLKKKPSSTLPLDGIFDKVT